MASLFSLALCVCSTSIKTSAESRHAASIMKPKHKRIDSFLWKMFLIKITQILEMIKSVVEKRKKMANIYFLCTGNSARSQMAEAFGKKYLNQNWQVQSAGVESHGLNPLAVQVMNEAGMDISKQYSKLIDNSFLQSCRLIVTLCGDARDRCPMTPASIEKIHWDIIDPAQTLGSKAEKLAVFRQVRDDIENRMIKLSQNIGAVL